MRQYLHSSSFGSGFVAFCAKNRNADAQLNALKQGNGVVIDYLSVHFLCPGERLDEIACAKIRQLLRFGDPPFGFRNSDLLLGILQHRVVFHQGRIQYFKKNER